MAEKNNSMTLAEWAAEVGMSDATIAGLLGITRQAVHKLRTGQSNPSRETADKIYTLSAGMVAFPAVYTVTPRPKRRA